MKTLYLERTSRPKQTDGVLIMPNGREFQSLECPWKDNKPFESCIPDGVYLIEPYQSPKFGSVYIISGSTVSKFQSPLHKRYGCLFHAANSVAQLAGCVALGFGWYGDNLRDSREAHKMFMSDMNGESGMLFVSGLNEWG